MYRKLEPIQGSCVPVFLGEMNMERCAGQRFYYDIYIDVEYMIFMSWGGVPLPREDEVRSFESARPGLNLCREIQRSARSLHLRGVAHLGIHRRNVLWSDEKKRVVFIDFEKSDFSYFEGDSELEELQRLDLEKARELYPGLMREEWRKEGGEGGQGVTGKREKGSEEVQILITRYPIMR